MTEDELIALGSDAEVLLSSSAFTQTVNSLVDNTFQTFSNSPPDKPDERETAHSSYRALVDIVNTLRQRVSVRDEIIAKNESKTEE